MEHVTAIAQSRLDWMNGLSEEDKAKLEAEKANWATEEFKAERMAEMNATFQAADTNQDGVLDKAEFADFMNKMSQNAKARGVPAMSEDDVDEATKDAVWGLFNGESDGDGVKPADVGAVIMKIGARTRELTGQ